MGQWLSQQHQVKVGNADDEPLKLVETWDVNHVQVREDDKFYPTNRFSISESGMFGISCAESPSLSVMYWGTDKSPAVLSNKLHLSSTFVKVSGKEYLATACDEDGCLYLWDIESKTSKKVFDPKLPSEQGYKGMNIFRINKSTIGYGESCASQDGSRRVFILKMQNDQWTLSSALRLFTLGNIFDMCYTELDGGTPCLLLCIPADSIMAVEMVGCKTRWELGKEHMGEKFQPHSICTDQNDCAYVANYGQRKIHLLSTTDGVLIKQFDPGNFDIWNITAVRFHDQHLYVEHKIPHSKYEISKFKEND